MSTVLVVDDEKNILRTLKLVLEGEGYQVHTAPNRASAERLLRSESSIEAILLDVKLGSDNGLELLEALRRPTTDVAPELASSIPVIMISGHASLDDAVHATRLGAFDFLEKPLDRNRVVVTVRNAIEHHVMIRQVHRLKDAVDSRYELVGESEVMVALRRHIAKVAPTKTRVLITGESGTGKELIARALHQNSQVSAGTFVKVNCAAIAPELIESELFGHEKGAFTGATGMKRGLFEVASGGTIFLDEIGDMSLSAQAKVLRVLQTGDFTRVGGEETLHTDCRVLAATNKNLEAAVTSGEFREDLFFRLNVVPIQSPPLRDRSDDIPVLLHRFVSECCEENGMSHKEISPEVVKTLQAYAWPGNVRELRNVAERLVIMSDEYIMESDLPPYLGGDRATSLSSSKSLDMAAHTDKSLREFREAVETEFIVHRLESFDWNISRTAQSLGIERTNLHKKLRALGIQRPEGNSG